MRKLTLEILAATALTLAAILALTPGVMASDVMVMEAFARASATPHARTAAAYVSLMNHGEADRLLSVATKSAAMAEIHATQSNNDVMSMGEAGAIEIPSGGMIEMKPGGLHIMLVGLTAPLKKGDKITLELTFEKAGKVGVEVPVGSVAATGHDHTPAAGSSGG